MQPAFFIVIFYFLLLLIGIPVAWLIIRKLTQPNINDSIVINHRANRTEGRIIGNLIEKKVVKNGRLNIKYVSRDSMKNDIVEIIVEPTSVVTHPRGSWSKEKNIIEILPTSAQEYVSNFVKSIEIANADSMIINAQREGLDRAKFHLLDIGEGEISAVNMRLKEDFVKGTIQSASKEDTARKPGGYQSGKDVFTA